MEKILRILTVLLIVVGLTAVLVGCGGGSGSGGMGGQGTVFNIHQNAPPGNVTPPAMPPVMNMEDLPKLAANGTEGAGNISIIYFTIVDGGTGFPNPLPSSAPSPPEPPGEAKLEATTQPTQ